MKPGNKGRKNISIVQFRVRSNIKSGLDAVAPLLADVGGGRSVSGKAGRTVSGKAGRPVSGKAGKPIG